MKITDFDFNAFNVETFGDTPLNLLKKNIEISFRQFIHLLSKVDLLIENDFIDSRLVNKYRNLLTAVHDEYKTLAEFKPSGKTATDVSRLSSVLTRIGNVISSFYEDNNKWLTTVCVINTIYQNETTHMGNFIELKRREIQENAKELEEITEQARINASKTVTSNYSKIFSDEAEKNGDAARIWLIIAILSMIIFAVTLLISINNDWFKIFNSEPLIYNGQAVILNGRTPFMKTSINYPNLVTKFALISLGIYLINFFFRQYSIKKHLESLNKHRNNALNGYTLFVDSINPNDPNSRGALMLNVAKAIYDHSNTGYIQEKQSGNNGVIELTKFIGTSKTVD